MGKASRAKDLRRQEAAVQRALAARVKQSMPGDRLKVLKRQTGRKVSELLMDLAEPWLDEARNNNERNAVIRMAVLAWNMAVQPETERWEGMDPELAKRLGEPGKAILVEMISDKLALYPEESRPILDYEITNSGDDVRVDVVYPLLPEEIADLKKGK